MHPHEPKSEQGKNQTRRIIHHVQMQRQERTFEQRVMQETNRQTESGHVKRDMPPWAPRGGYGSSCEESSASAEKYAHEQKCPERLLIRQEFRGYRTVQCLPPSR